MPTRDPRIDTYIAKSAPFARPILEHVRDLIHTACPDIEETYKWSTPAFYYKGPLCGVAAFKQYCSVGFWKAPLLAKQGFKESADYSLGRITSLDELPADRTLIKLIKAAVALNDQGVKLERPKRPPKPPVKPPPYFTAAVKKNKQALAAYQGFSPSHKREYVGWITDAKSDATRDRRLAQAVAWMAEGRSRNWKYQ